MWICWWTPARTSHPSIGPTGKDCWTRQWQSSPEHTAFSDQGDAYGISDSPVAYGIEEAAFYFRTEDNQLLVQVVDARIALDDTTAGIPSLLGRDILSTARLDFNMPAGLLMLEWPT